MLDSCHLLKISINNVVSVLVSEFDVYHMSLEVDVRVLLDCTSLYSIKGILLELSISNFICSDNLIEQSLHFDKHKLVLGHHVLCLRMNHRLCMIFLQSLFSSLLSE